MYSGKATYIQSQFPYAIGQNSSVPMSIPGMVGGSDFLTFLIPPGFPSGYQVTVPVLIGNDFNRTIGPLRPRFILPNAHFDPNGSVALVHPNPAYPAFMAPMHRGGTYTVPAIKKLGRGQVYLMHWSR